MPTSNENRESLGLDVAIAKDSAGWLALLRSLIAHGLSGGQLVISSAHTGLVNANGAPVPGASRHRCRPQHALHQVSRRATY
ncbi:transposase [Streptomyces sp. NPDC050625]|uniref:transposase n=1 Tax=Streptomyces sp. NPDC050625 TaxID=3154629 RepID=UPI003415A192